MQCLFWFNHCFNCIEIHFIDVHYRMPLCMHAQNCACHVHSHCNGTTTTLGPQACPYVICLIMLHTCFWSIVDYKLSYLFEMWTPWLCKMCDYQSCYILYRAFRPLIWQLCYYGKYSLVYLCALGPKIRIAKCILTQFHRNCYECIFLDSYSCLFTFLSYPATCFFNCILYLYNIL